MSEWVQGLLIWLVSVVAILGLAAIILAAVGFFEDGWKEWLP